MTEAKKIGKRKPVLRLVGEDGNAYAILGRACRAMTRDGWSEAQIKAVLDEMRAGDYDHLLRVACERFEVDPEFEFEDEED